MYQIFISLYTLIYMISTLHKYNTKQILIILFSLFGRNNDWAEIIACKAGFQRYAKKFVLGWNLILQ